jgi:lipopolysaccharide/colanic/teichoic acid biosynthesis glycosyltransferase
MVIISNVARHASRMATYLWWKSVLDRLFALLLLIILSPIMALIALAIRIDSPGNPIFCQERAGKDRRLFTFYKFRSMYQNHDDSKYQAYWKKYIQENSSALFDENGKDVYELINDPRITRFGSLMRRLNLDELPQLINVLKGDMSFVGPRPDMDFALEYYQEHHLKRFQVKPGITGPWQVFENRRRIGFEDMVTLDLDYINRQSLLLDAKIILLTLRELLSFGGRQKEVREIKMNDGIKA